MKHGVSVTFLAVLFLGTVFCPFFSGDGAGLWGAGAAKADKELTIPDMLRYAIEDEYLAHAEYTAIIKQFGSIRPFSNIIQAEETHIGWLRAEFGSRNIAVPEDRGAHFVVLPANVTEAMRAGEQAEIDNIAMYERFLEAPEIRTAGNKALAELFTRLADASRNHLKAFRGGK
jgi:rubrerythrin